MIQMAWKELGDTQFGKKVTDAYCSTDKYNCYVNLRQDGKWHWSVFYYDPKAKAIIDGSSDSLAAGKAAVMFLINSLEKLSDDTKS